MPLQPLSYELSVFEKLEVCRIQIKEREEELEQVEMKIRTLLYELKKSEYLHTVCAAYPTTHPESATFSEEIQALEMRRNQLHDIIDALNKTMPTLQKGGTGAVGGTGVSADGKRPAISLDAFKQKFPNANL